jgi:hydroxymethylpyrimidine kinase/phosphomethylpyrimidine kinase/thiamine-phosphate diphosphorylase
MIENIVWTIAGSDSSGGAGIQADLKTFQGLGVYGCSVLTAITAQNNQDINEIEYLSKSLIGAQLSTLDAKFPAKAIKIGMLGHPDTIKVIGLYLMKFQGQIVLDPLLASTLGRELISGDLKQYLMNLNELFKFVDLFTPNLVEAEKILNRPLRSYQDIQEGAKELLTLGVKAVLIKGGHFGSDPFSQDYWTDGEAAFWLANKRLEARHYHGTGCTLSAAIAACLALGYEMKDAVVIAKMYVNRSIRLALPIDGKTSRIYHATWPEDELDLPYLSAQPILETPFQFLPCETKNLGLYPVVDSLSWVKTLLPSGVKLLQLRIKNKQGSELENAIKESIQLAKQYQAKLFINDYWEYALNYGAYGVHLGQKDLSKANFKDMKKAGLRLGISTHCYSEVAAAHLYRPSYLACGPIFYTTSKLMTFAPQGIEQLKRWRRTLKYPLVAIGGINKERLPDILSTQVNGVALISAITKAKDPLEETKHLMTMVDQYANNER